MFIKTYPDQIDLLAFFESEPIVNEAHDLHYAYKTSDDNGLEIIFSFCVTAGWLKTVISLNGKIVSQYLTEQVNEIKLRKDNIGEYLYTEIITDELITEIEVRAKPDISVNSSSLVR